MTLGLLRILTPERQVMGADDDVRAWAGWMAENDEARRVGLTAIQPDIEISTVFLGIECLGGCFETAIFDETTGGCDVVGRYETWAQAEAGHQQHVANAVHRVTGLQEAAHAAIEAAKS